MINSNLVHSIAETTPTSVSNHLLVACDGASSSLCVLFACDTVDPHSLYGLEQCLCRQEAWDTNLLLSLKVKPSSSVSPLDSCLEETKTRMSEDLLNFQGFETEAVYIGTPHQFALPSLPFLQVGLPSHTPHRERPRSC